jgi:hypothetical protein
VRFSFHSLPSLPRLAWAARVRADDPIVPVLHGSCVETGDDWFVEGAWDAPFAAGDFDRSTVLTGSGGRTTDAGVLFATPANLYERLQSVRVGPDLFVSNSLAFLLALSGDRLDPDHRHYYLDLLDFYRVGIATKEKRLRLAGGRAVSLHDCCNLLVAPDGGTTRVEKAWGTPPASYDDYAALLERTIRLVMANASDTARRLRYRPLAMISQGYDTTAVAAVARRLGCGEAVTFLRSDSRGEYADDSGEAIARRLGYALTSYERNDFARMTSFRAEEFYLEPWGVDRNMAVMEAQLAGALLLSGRSGETVWSRGLPGHWGLPDLQHPIEQTPGCALGEFRLRVGFQHFAPATIAAFHAPVIHAWNDAPALRPWSVGGSYDKPIARRLAEDGGVPRELFGQVKKGGPERVAEPRQRLPRWLGRRLQHPRNRARIRRWLGNRLHPRWKQGSFEVQAGAERMSERYRQAVARDAPAALPAAGRAPAPPRL